MRLYDDKILVDCTMGDPYVKGGNMMVNLHARYWTISHTWKDWAIKINDNLILN